MTASKLKIDDHGTLMIGGDACQHRPPCWMAVVQAHGPAVWSKDQFGQVEANLCIDCGGTRIYRPEVPRTEPLESVAEAPDIGSAETLTSADMLSDAESEPDVDVIVIAPDDVGQLDLSPGTGQA